MRSKKYRVQRDSLRAINLSISLFIKLLTKTCEVVQSTSTSSGIGGKRLANTLDIEHLSKAIKRYDVLGFLSDLVSEMNQRLREPTSLGSLESLIVDHENIDPSCQVKRKPMADEAVADDQGSKKQRSITSFFTRT
jgi:hypothetical protein